MDAPIEINLSDVAQALELRTDQVRRTVELLDAGNTIPFISRYRKDYTGGLDEEHVRAVEARVAQSRALADRKEKILRAIESQGQLSPELAASIAGAESLRQLEDLYLPYKPKKQTLATLARDRGLGPLAEDVLQGVLDAGQLNERAATLVSAERELPEVADVLAGVRHIIAERYSERADLRNHLRRFIWQYGLLASNRTETTPTQVGKRPQHEGHYRDYFEYREPLVRVPPHRLLAINRGEKAKVLRVRIEVDDAALVREAARIVLDESHPLSDFLRASLDDALSRLLFPSLEREIRRELTEKAETHAVQVFAKNLRHVLLQPPLRNRRVLAVDPGLRSGAKLAALDEFGRLLEHAIVYLVGSDEKREEAKRVVSDLVRRHDTRVIAIGNGTGCRQAEEMVAELIAGELAKTQARYVVVNEAGASVYSTSPTSREEFPDLDATLRGTISIGRRLQDPLSELVKIDPASIGVGLYQHDIKARHLRESLDAVVESCVNYVGVDVNSASPALLRYVSGLNQLTARRLYDYRQEHGPFRNRQQFMDVPGFGEAAFVQAAGFLKIVDGDNGLDATWIHPESYSVAEQLLSRLGTAVDPNGGHVATRELTEQAATLDRHALAQELGCGELALGDIIANLVRPGRDPREDLPPPLFKEGVLKLEDLEPGMELTGTVLNVVDFGAFVDIGLHDSGLVHVSQMSSGYVSSPHDVVAVGDVIKVWVLAVDTDRRRVSLAMISPAERAEREAAARQTHQKPPSADRPQKRRRRSRKASDSPSESKPAVKRQRKARRGSRTSAPAVVLTQKMQDGKEPVRSFAALKQLLQQKQTPGDPSSKEA